VLSNWAINVLERRAVDRFIAVSQAVADKNRLAHTGVPYEIIPNFVPKEVEDDLEGAEHYIKQLPGNDFLLFVGELSRDKGVHVALRAYEKLADALPLVLIGRRGTDFPDDVPANVIVLESWPHRYIGLAFRRSLFTLVPSIWFEPFGLVAIEAMAAGRPIVASRIGGLKDIVVDGVTGILVPAGDAESLLAAMGLLLNDSQLRDRMGIAARRRAVEFSLDAIIPAIERAYKSALESE
jgi:glycosyltransferase involved in cell wall biosynthesis